MNILAGDIGGTHTRLLLAEIEAGNINILQQQCYPSQHYDDLVPVVQQFLQECGEQQRKPQRACFAVAGPVRDNKTKITNLPWRLSTSALSAALHIEHVRLINDFEGIGYGMGHLGEADYISLQAGNPEEQGTRVILGAGTGLGQAMLIWCNDQYQVHGSEGGHVTFAARTEQQIHLLQHLLQRQSRVSYEDLLSGQGLVRLYQYCCQSAGKDRDEVTTDFVEHREAAAIIAQRATTHQDKHAATAISLFMSIYGARAGDLALSHKATGGIFISGGIARKNLTAIQSGEFLQAFTDKPPMTALLQTIPVKVIVNPYVGMLGAMEFCIREQEQV